MMTTTIIRFNNYAALFFCIAASFCFFLGVEEGETIATIGLMLIIALPLFRVLGMTRKYPMAWVLLLVWLSIGTSYLFT